MRTGFLSFDVFLSWLWLAWIVCLIPYMPGSYLEVTLVLSPVLIILFRGLAWLRDYELKNILFFTFLLFLLLSVLAQFINSSAGIGLDSVRDFHLKLIAVGFSLLFLVRSRFFRKAMLQAMVCGLLVASVCSYVEWGFGHDWLFWDRSSAWPEAIAPFQIHKNVFAQNLAYFQPVLLSTGLVWGLVQKKYVRGSLAILVLLCSLPVTFMSLSRSGQVATLTGLLLVVIVAGLAKNTREILFYLGLTVGVLVVLIVSMSTFPVMEESIRRWQVDRNFLSLSGRMTRVWPEVLNNFNTWDQWVFGFSFESKISAATIYEHSIYLQLLNRTGLVGLLSYLVFATILVFQSLLRIFRDTSSVDSLILTGLVTSFVVGTFFVGFSENISEYNFYFYNSLLLSLILYGQNGQGRFRNLF